MGLLARGQEPCCGGLPVSELAEAASFVKDKIKHTDAFISVRFKVLRFDPIPSLGLDRSGDVGTGQRV